MAKGMTGAGVNQPEHPVGGQRTAASQTSFTASESDVRHSEGVRGGPLQGDFWS